MNWPRQSEFLLSHRQEEVAEAIRTARLEKYLPQYPSRGRIRRARLMVQVGRWISSHGETAMERERQLAGL